MMEEKIKAEQDQSAQDKDDRSYEAPELSTLGTVGELTSANEGSLDV
jgi:hypothetical protein